MGLRKCVALFFALAGMGTIFSFSIHLYDVWPAFCAILAGIMGGAEVVFTKKISNRYSALQILVFVFVTMAVCNGIISLFIGEKLPPLLMVTSWYAQIGYALSMLAAMYCVVKGFKHVQPAVGSILGTAEIVFAVLLGHFFFHEVVGVVTYIGIVAIISSVLLTSVQRNPRQE